MDTDIVQSTRSYETWLASQTRVVSAGLRLKHLKMAESPFIFLRGTFYRWIQQWSTLPASLTGAPPLVAVGDLHIENFGTWRDAEGRLIWGVNDVDEACVLPYTQDLVRLATSACLAVREGHFGLSNRAVCDAILEGYAACIERGGRAIVLEERSAWLRRIALSDLRNPQVYWAALQKLPVARGIVPHAALRSMLPAGVGAYSVRDRVAGVGSLGRQRVLALVEWQGGRIAREAKAWAPSAALWAKASRNGDAADALLAQAFRAADPCFAIRKPWIVRRLAPDCSRINLADLPKKRDEERLLRAMGWETANMHGRNAHRTVSRDLATRKSRWLLSAAGHMLDAVVADWRAWKRAN
jgi:hypothetical protein